MQRTSGEHLGHEFPCAGAGSQSDHVVPGSEDDIAQERRRADEGNAVRRHRPPPEPFFEDRLADRFMEIDGSSSLEQFESIAP